MNKAIFAVTEFLSRAMELNPEQRKVLQLFVRAVFFCLPKVTWPYVLSSATGIFLARDVAAIRTCRICGCTENNACMSSVATKPWLRRPCHWVEADLCSACVGIELPSILMEKANADANPNAGESLYAGVQGDGGQANRRRAKAK